MTLDRTNRHGGQYKLFLADLLPIAMETSHMPDTNKKVLVTHDVRQVQGCHVLQQDTPDVALE
jgi:hypothetical protein